MRHTLKNLAVAFVTVVILAGALSAPHAVDALPGAFLTISHAVDLSLIRPGETATFTITVVNEGDAPAHQVVISNPLPSVFMVTSAESSRGSTAVAGQLVTLTLDTLNPDERVVLKVVAGVRTSVKPPVDTLNSATITYSGGPPRNAGAALRITGGTLPATGEHPDEPDFSVVWTGALLALLAGLAIFLHDRRRAVRRS